MAVMHRARAAMQFELSVAVAAALMFASFIVDWPRAAAGVVLGVICRFLPYGTILVPIGVALVSGAIELFYTWIGHRQEPHLWNFLIGLFAVGGTASTVFVTIRNLKDRL
jgi:hypothetical protein